MKRLVYAPSMRVWVKTDSGVVDLSPYVIDCQVSRAIDDVSHAEVKFRNPKVIDGSGKNRFMFTQREINGEIRPVFHPMDPITIVMERMPGVPVQVFTGYCDTTPYVQLFPGVCRIKATCTLKRLLYTFWDPGLSFVRDFMIKYGWIINTQTGVANKNTEGNGKLNDGSIGNLLYAVLNEIGGWDDSNIFIQPLPGNISHIAMNLFTEIAKDDKEVNQQLAEIMSKFVGTGSFGGSTAGGGSSSNAPSTTPGNGSNTGVTSLGPDWESAVSAYSGGGYGTAHLNSLYASSPQNGQVPNDRNIVKEAAAHYKVPFCLLWATYGAESSWGKASSYFGLTGAHPGSGTSGNFRSDAFESASTWLTNYRQHNGGKSPNY